MSEGFTRAFRTSALAALFRQPELLPQMREALRPDLWEDSIERIFAGELLSIYDAHHVVPQIDAVVQKLSLRNTTNPRLLQICGVQLSSASLDGVAPVLREFLSVQTIRLGLLRSIDILNTGGAEKALDSLQEIRLPGNASGYNYGQQTQERWEAYRLGKFFTERIPTGVASLDTLLCGGIGRGELGTLAGRAKVGKTLVLINFGRAAYLAGHRVLHVTLEVNTSGVAARYDSSSLRRSRRALSQSTPPMPSTGELWIYEYPMGITPVSVLVTLVRKHRPDLLLVDYGDLFLSNTTNDTSTRFSLARIWRFLRGIAQENKLAVWTATQINRSGSDKTTASGMDLAECWDKVASSDLVITLNQTVEEGCLQQLRFFISEAREVPDKKSLTVFCDKELCYIGDLQGLRGVQECLTAG